MPTRRIASAASGTRRTSPVLPGGPPAAREARIVARSTWAAIAGRAIENFADDAHLIEREKRRQLMRFVRGEIPTLVSCRNLAQYTQLYSGRRGWSIYRIAKSRRGRRSEAEWTRPDDQTHVDVESVYRPMPAAERRRDTHQARSPRGLRHSDRNLAVPASSTRKLRSRRSVFGTDENGGACCMHACSGVRMRSAMTGNKNITTISLSLSLSLSFCVCVRARAFVSEFHLSNKRYWNYCL